MNKLKLNQSILKTCDIEHGSVATGCVSTSNFRCIALLKYEVSNMDLSFQRKQQRR